MTEKKGPNDQSGARDPRARIVTVYDRLEDARARREKALSKRPPSPAKPKAAPLLREPAEPAREKGATMTAVVSSLKASSERADSPKAAAATYAAPPPSSRPRRKRILAFGAVPVMVGLAAVALPLPTSEMPPVEDKQIATLAPTTAGSETAEAVVTRNLSIGPSVIADSPQTLTAESTETTLDRIITPERSEPVRTASLVPGIAGTGGLAAEITPPTAAVVRDVPELGPDVFAGDKTLHVWNISEGPTTLSAALPSDVVGLPIRSDGLDGLVAIYADERPDDAEPLPTSVAIWSDLANLSALEEFGDTSVRLASLGATAPAFGTPASLSSAPRPGDLSEAVLASLQPPAALDLPPFSEAEDAAMRVVLHIPDQVADSRVAELVDAAQASGLTVDRLVRTPFNVSGTNIRYYHDGDLGPAEALADALGARARDFTNFSPTPDEGLIEIYAEGKSKPRPRVIHTPAPQAVAAAEQPKRYRVIRIIKPKRTFNPFRRGRDDDDNDRIVEVVTMSTPPTPGMTLSDILDAANEGSGDDSGAGDDTGGDSTPDTGDGGGTGADGDDGSSDGGDTTGGSGDPTGDGDTTGGDTGDTDGGNTTGGDSGDTGGGDTTGGDTGGDTSGGDSDGSTGGGDTSGGGDSGSSSDDGGSSGSDGGSDDSSGSSGGSSGNNGGGNGGGGGGSSDGTSTSEN